MASSREFHDFIMEQLSALSGVTSRKMMGEYVVYYREKVAALICDDRLFIKAVPAALRLFPDVRLEPAYTGGSPMIPVENVDDAEALCRTFQEIYDDLPFPKPRKRKS